MLTFILWAEKCVSRSVAVKHRANSFKPDIVEALFTTTSSSIFNSSLPDPLLLPDRSITYMPRSATALPTLIPDDRIGPWSLGRHSHSHRLILQGLPTRHDKVDIVVMRENTDGEYHGIEHEVVPDLVESLNLLLLFVMVSSSLIYIFLGEIGGGTTVVDIRAQKQLMNVGLGHS